MPTCDNASGITCGCQQQKGTDLVKIWIAHWVCDDVAGRSKYPFLHVGGGGLVPDFIREAVHREQMRELLYDEAPFQSEMLQSTTASDMPDARSAHENVPQIDDPLFLGPDLAEHADRMKIKAEQQNELNDSAAHTTYGALSLSGAWPAKTSWAISWWLTDYDHETADSRWKSLWRTREPLLSGALDKLGRFVSPRLDPLLAPTGTPRKPMCHLADPPETPSPELGATALPTLHAAVLGWHT